MLILESSSTDSKKVWIYDKAKAKPVNEQAVTVDEDGNEIWLLEAECAHFNGDNENERIYDEKEYIEDHFKAYLKGKVERGELMGELDHPEEFIVQLKNASHIVRKLWYDADNKKLFIQIELFDTPEGEKVKAILRKGGVVFISSRASGLIGNDGRVYLEKIYAYDIVSDAGFGADAELKRVYESVDGTYAIYEFRDKRIDNPSKPSEMKLDSETKKEIVDSLLKSIREELGLKANKPQLIKESLKVPETVSYQGIEVQSLMRIPEVNESLELNQIRFNVEEVIDIEGSDSESEYAPMKGTFKYGIRLKDDSNQEFMGYVSDSGAFLVDKSALPQQVAKEKSSEAPAVLESKVDDLIKGYNNQELVIESLMDYMEGMRKIMSQIIEHGDETAMEITSIRESIGASHESSSSDDTLKKLNRLSREYKRLLNMVKESSNGYKTIKDKVLENQNVALSLKRHPAAQKKNRPTVPVKKVKNTNTPVFEEKLDKDTMVMLSKQVKTALQDAELEATEENIKAILRNMYLEDMGVSVDDIDISSMMDMVSESKKPNPKNKVSAKELAQKALKNHSDAETRKAELQMAELKGQYSFLKLVDSKTVEKFQKASPVLREFAAKRVKNMGSRLRGHALAQVITESLRVDDSIIKLLDSMPKTMVKSWNSLSSDRQQNIIALFRSKNISSEVRMKEFWKTVNLKESRPMKRLEDPQSVPRIKDEVSNLGYSDADIDGALGIV